MRFENFDYIYLLLLIPIMFIIEHFIYKYKIYKLKKLGNYNLIKNNLILENLNIIHLRKISFYVALILLIIAIMRPQYGSTIDYVELKGLDIVIALDVSESMRAEDIAPNRIIKAKDEIKRFINLLHGDRVALVTFAYSSHLISPLTNDYSALKMYIDNIDFDMVAVQGTSIANAINESLKAFDENTTGQNIIILLTDGEDHEQYVIEAAQKAADQNVIIFTIGIGRQQGTLVPVRDRHGTLIKYKKDRQGIKVVSKFNPTLLQAISAKTGGKFYHAMPGRFDMNEVFSLIKTMEQEIFDKRENIKHNEIYQYVLLISVMFFILYIFLYNKV